jgi:hypothetical protein
MHLDAVRPECTVYALMDMSLGVYSLASIHDGCKASTLVVGLKHGRRVVCPNVKKLA